MMKSYHREKKTLSGLLSHLQLLISFTYSPSSDLDVLGSFPCLPFYVGRVKALWSFSSSIWILMICLMPYSSTLVSSFSPACLIYPSTPQPAQHLACGYAQWKMAELNESQVDEERLMLRDRVAWGVKLWAVGWEEAIVVYLC